jgi:uracil-DNA glycosylase
VDNQNRLTDSQQLDAVSLPAPWQAVLQTADVQAQLQSIKGAINQQLSDGVVIYPADPWYALRITPLDSIKVVILGQDPYHGAGQAQGLAFSVSNAQRTPPSLRNIFIEIDRDPDIASGELTAPPRNDLSRWAKQGVMLLNTSLTVQDGQAGSHAELGWKNITNALLDAVVARAVPTVYLLWGQHAQTKRERIERLAQNHPHLILQANHPSPLSARRLPTPFIGCGHFSQANHWLIAHGLSPVAWADEQQVNK